MPEIFQIDDSRMNVALGDARRVPSFAYKNWGIPEGAYRTESEDLYAIEWEGGSAKQMEYVIEALKFSGMENFSQMLRDKNAEVVSHLIGKTGERVNYLEPGAGVSTVNLYKKMIADGIDVERVY